MHEAWIEGVIRKAEEAGEFDNLAGSGQPIPGISRPYDPAWWARNWIASDRARQRAIELTQLVERELPRILAGDVTDKARTDLESLNVLIVENNKASQEGNGLPLLDVDRLLEERAHRCKGR